MRENGLRGRQKRRFKRTTDSEHAWPIAPNIIDQDLTATAPNQKRGVELVEARNKLSIYSFVPSG